MEITSRNATRFICVLIGCCLALCCSRRAQGRRTAEADLHRSGQPPDGPGASRPRCLRRARNALQWSSWDRASKYDEATGKYVNWDANGDGDGIIRKEGDAAGLRGDGGPGRHLADLVGPGRRRPRADLPRRQAEPAVDLPFIGYFDGKNEPSPARPWSTRQPAGQNSYVPIPFQKSCKIIAERRLGRLLPLHLHDLSQGHHVPTFTRKLSAEENCTPWSGPTRSCPRRRQRPRRSGAEGRRS